MKIETFFEKFGQLADAPNAMDKLRELVLRLAFSGGLSGKLSNEDRLPVGWERRTIESIALSVTPGFACSRSHQVDAGHVHLRTHNISTLGTLNFDLLVRIDPKMVDPAKASIRHGDILFNNTNSQELVGKTSLVDRDYNYGFSNHINRIRLKEGIYPGFVVFYLTLLRNSGYFAQLCTRWINQAAVNTDTLKKQIIPLPPLAEQKRIVAKVDELMVLCDRLEAQQQERDKQHAALARASLTRFAEAPTPANLDFLFHKSYAITPADLRKSILTLAVQGKLVPQDANDVPVQITFPDVKPLEAELSGDTVMPRLWARCKYRSLTSLVTSGSRGWKEFYSKTGAIFMRTQNIKTDQLVLDDVAFVQLPKSAEGMRAQVIKGDILITITGANVTKAARVEKQIPEAYVSQHIALTRPRWPTMSQWLHLCFVSHGAARGTLEKLAYGDKPGLNLNNIRDLVLPIPPLAEQRRIVAKVDQLMALVDQLETQLAESRATAARLMEAVVAELTAQV
jgi:type I restriction enzyme S subunit